MCSIPNHQDGQGSFVYREFTVPYYGMMGLFTCCFDCWQRIAQFGRDWIDRMTEKYGR